MHESAKYYGRVLRGQAKKISLSSVSEHVTLKSFGAHGQIQNRQYWIGF